MQIKKQWWAKTYEMIFLLPSHVHNKFCQNICRMKMFRATSRQDLGFHVYTNSVFPSWNLPTHLKFLGRSARVWIFLLNLMASYVILLLYFVFRFCILLFPDPIGSIIVCVEAQQKSASPLFCPLMMTAAYCRPTTKQRAGISIFWYFCILHFLFCPFISTAAYCRPITKLWAKYFLSCCFLHFVLSIQYLTNE